MFGLLRAARVAFALKARQAPPVGSRQDREIVKGEAHLRIASGFQRPGANPGQRARDVAAVHLQHGTIGTIVCDKTVLTRGTTVCP